MRPSPQQPGDGVRHLGVSVIGADRPGIVAAVTGVLLDQGCNLADTSMTILSGNFAMMLVVAAPPSVDAATLEAGLLGVAAELDLMISVRPVAEATEVDQGNDTAWAVSLHGADHPGIVHAVASLLAGAGANIVDLTTRVVGSAERPAYVMLLDVAIPATVEPVELDRRLHGLADHLGVAVSLHPVDVEVL